MLILIIFLHRHFFMKSSYLFVERCICPGLSFDKCVIDRRVCQRVLTNASLTDASVNTTDVPVASALWHRRLWNKRRICLATKRDSCLTNSLQGNERSNIITLYGYVACIWPTLLRLTKLEFVGTNLNFRDGYMPLINQNKLSQVVAVGNQR